VRAVEAARELGSQSAFDGVRQQEVVPGALATGKQDVIDFVRTAAASFGHPVGTAKMGTGADRQLKVYQETGDLKKVVDYMVAETRVGVFEGAAARK